MPSTSSSIANCCSYKLTIQFNYFLNYHSSLYWIAKLHNVHPFKYFHTTWKYFCCHPLWKSFFCLTSRQDHLWKVPDISRPFQQCIPLIKIFEFVFIILSHLYHIYNYPNLDNQVMGNFRPYKWTESWILTFVKS